MHTQRREYTTAREYESKHVRRRGRANGARLRAGKAPWRDGWRERRRDASDLRLLRSRPGAATRAREQDSRV
jgi:hypothetical protein